MTRAHMAAMVAPVLFVLVSDAAAQPPAPPPLRLARLYQGRREPEQSERISRKVRIGRDGRVSVSNISGDITISASGGEEVSIDAVKRGSRRYFDRVSVVIDDKPGRVDVSTQYDQSFRGVNNNNDVSVDYTLSVPEGASLDLKSVSGTVRVSAVRGSVRLQSISGTLVATNAPRVEFARTVSGGIDLNGVSSDGDLSVSIISGSLRANGLKARSLDINSVSGDVLLRGAACERVTSRSISGNFEYDGTLVRSGRYDVNTHSGEVRFVLADNTGFELNAGSFSGSVRSDFEAPVNVDRGGRRGPGPGRRFGPGNTVRTTVGDGSARLELHTFSGSVAVTKR